MEIDMTKNADGKFYVCDTCKSSIDKNIEPRRTQKEILGFLNFPEELKKVLDPHCIPADKDNPKGPRKIELNRLED